MHEHLAVVLKYCFEILCNKLITNASPNCPNTFTALQILAVTTTASGQHISINSAFITFYISVHMKSKLVRVQFQKSNSDLDSEQFIRHTTKLDKNNHTYANNKLEIHCNVINLYQWKIIVKQCLFLNENTPRNRALLEICRTSMMTGALAVYWYLMPFQCYVGIKNGWRSCVKSWVMRPTQLKNIDCEEDKHVLFYVSSVSKHILTMLV